MFHLRGTQADVVVDTTAGAPVIAYWGRPLGAIDDASLTAALARPVAQGSLGVVAPLSVVPEHGSGYPGRPGLNGHRQGGTAWSARFQPSSVGPIADGIEVVATDPVAELQLVCHIQLTDVLRVRCRVVNTGATRYLLDGLHPTLPLPVHASELLTFDGRWAREFHPIRRPWTSGAWISENRAGRTSHEHVPLLFAGAPGFGEWIGEVWGVHVAWSGDHTLLAECLADGRRAVQAGELLHPGEVCLEPGDAYDSPELVATYSEHGLTPASWGFHRSLRSYPVAPSRPRPVLLNTWEAVYFDHDQDRLRELASTAARLGVERFVLDDGWFGSRRDDTSGLGDWVVSPEVYPDGLHGLVDHVRGLGMEFGIWVEPEMVNPDSDVYRAHPDWVLADAGYQPVLGRNQLVLNIGHPDAFAHVFGRLDALLRDHDIAFVKWDMNRNHVHASDSRGAAGSGAQTRALYRLLDALRAAHPSVEFESCASGGGRIDHEILRRAERVWTSDCNDPLERQTIQWGTSMVVPYELMGAHVGPARSHTTGRVHSLAFRVLTAMFGHFGVEWDVLSISETDRSQLADAIALHQRFRPLVHSGDVVRFDPVANGSAPASHAYGVYAADRREALIAHVQLASGMSLVPPPLRLPGLTADTRYRVEQVPLPGSRLEWPASGLTLTGAQLAAHGLQLPRHHPESGILLHLVAV